MGSIGHLRLMHTTSLQQQPTQQQQLVQSIDLKSTISSANNALPITSDHNLNGLIFSSNNNNKNDSNIVPIDDLHSPPTASESDVINSFLVPKSLNFIIDRLSKVRDEISTIERDYGHSNSMPNMFSDNNHQNAENDHNVGNNNIINLSENIKFNEASSNNNTSSNYNNRSSAKISHTIVRGNHEKNQDMTKYENCQDTNNSSSESNVLSQNDNSSPTASSTPPSSSSNSSSTSKSSAKSFLSVPMSDPMQAADKTEIDKLEKKEQHAKSEYDSEMSYSNKARSNDELNERKLHEEKQDNNTTPQDEDCNEHIDVDDLTLSNMKSNNEISYSNSGDKSSRLNCGDRDKTQPMIESTEDTIMILKQLMDKRIELKRLDKLVFNLITQHLMKITSTSNAPTNYGSSKSINTMNSYEDRSSSASSRIPDNRYNGYNSFSTNDDCFDLHYVFSTAKDNEDLSTTHPSVNNNSARSSIVRHSQSINNDYRLSSENISSSSANNLSMSGNPSLIDLTSASSRHPCGISPKNHTTAIFDDNVTQKKTNYHLNKYLVPPLNDDNLFPARQRLLPKIHLSNYDGMSNSDALKFASICGQSEEEQELDKSLINSMRSNSSKTIDDCSSITGLNLKTTNNTCSTMDQSMSHLQDMHHSTHISASPMASTSFSLQAMASLQNSHYLNALSNNISNNNNNHNSLDLLNKQSSVNNLSSAAPNNDFCLNYSSHDREQRFHESPYQKQQIDNTSVGVSDLDHNSNGRVSSLPILIQNHHYGESLLKPPMNKKFRTSFGERSSKSTSNSPNNSEGTIQKSANYLFERGSLDYHQLRSLNYNNQGLDLPQKYCHQNSSQQSQLQNPTVLVSADTISPPSPATSSSSLLAYKQQEHSLLNYQHDFTNSLSSDHNNDNVIRASCNIVVENGNNNNTNSSCRLVCHVCGSGFEDRHRLQQHLSIHLQLKPEWYSESTIKETMAQYEAKRGDYLCGQCDVRFDTTAEFDRHMQLHGDKPHRCELCFHDNSFRYWRQYLTHFRNHCFVYHCRFVKGCNHQCNRRDYLKSHILKHHLDNRLPQQYIG